MSQKEFALNKDIYLECIDYIKLKHEGQYRKFSMCPYFVHPIRVAALVMKYKQSHMIDSLVLAALLHDVVEDTDTPLSEIERKYGAAVAGLVHELTSKKELVDQYGKAEYLTFKMKNMSSWALVIKLCDRLDNVMDFAYASDAFIAKYGKETEAILSSLTNLSETQARIVNDIRRIMAVYYSEGGKE